MLRTFWVIGTTVFLFVGIAATPAARAAEAPKRAKEGSPVRVINETMQILQDCLAVFPRKNDWLVITLGKNRALQAKSKQPIKRVAIPNDRVLTVRVVVDDSTTILVTGKSPGVAKVTLTDNDDQVQIYTVICVPDDKKK